MDSKPVLSRKKNTWKGDISGNWHRDSMKESSKGRFFEKRMKQIYKVVELVGEGLLSTRPTQSSLLSFGCCSVVSRCSHLLHLEEKKIWDTILKWRMGHSPLLNSPRLAFPSMVLLADFSKDLNSWTAWHPRQCKYFFRKGHISFGAECSYIHDSSTQTINLVIKMSKPKQRHDGVGPVDNRPTTE